MTAPLTRRGFLRGLTSLPLVGGGVTLIGAPSAVAEPVTEILLREYHDWLMYERAALCREMLGIAALPEALDGFHGRAQQWHRVRGKMRKGPQGALLGDGVSYASNRAALVLSAVDCDWREGAR